jgi:nucleoside-diphosphate-sugar epimerase
MKKILLLGGSGFLGSQVRSALSDFDLRSPNRMELLELVGEKEASEEFNGITVIINCLSATSLNSSKEEIYFVNYELPKKVFLKYSHKDVFWINFDTYFHLYFRDMGKHKNFYSESKYLFRDFLQAQPDDLRISIHNYVLPHLLGPTERRGRLVRDIFENISQGKYCKISSGNQIIPITDIKALAEYVRILLLDANLVTVNAKIFKEFYVPPVEILRVKDLAKIIADLYGRNSLLLNGENKYYDNEFFSMDWPNGSSPAEYPKMDLKSILNSYLLEFPAT